MALQLSKVHLRNPSESHQWSSPSLDLAQQTVFHISDPAVNETLANIILEHLNKTSEKRATLPA